jgi:hypothetical protein
LHVTAGKTLTNGRASNHARHSGIHLFHDQMFGQTFRKRVRVRETAQNSITKNRTVVREYVIHKTGMTNQWHAKRF